MSAQPTHGGGSQGARTTTNGGSAGAMPMSMPQHRPNDSTVNVSNGAQSGGMSQQNLNGIVRLCCLSTLLVSAYFILKDSFSFFSCLSLSLADRSVRFVKLEDQSACNMLRLLSTAVGEIWRHQDFLLV